MKREIIFQRNFHIKILDRINCPTELFKQCRQWNHLRQNNQWNHLNQLNWWNQWNQWNQLNWCNNSRNFHNGYNGINGINGNYGSASWNRRIYKNFIIKSSFLANSTLMHTLNSIFSFHSYASFSTFSTQTTNLKFLLNAYPSFNLVKIHSNHQQRFVHDWKKRQQSDPFIKKREQLGVRSRAFFKLKEILQKYKIKKMKVVIDLGCSPGSWIECILNMWKEMGSKQTICIGIDLLPVKPFTMQHHGIDSHETWSMQRESQKHIQTHNNNKNNNNSNNNFNSNNSNNSNNSYSSINKNKDNGIHSKDDFHIEQDLNSISYLEEKRIENDFFGSKILPTNSILETFNENTASQITNYTHDDSIHKSNKSTSDSNINNLKNKSNEKFIPRSVTEQDIKNAINDQKSFESSKVNTESDDYISIHTFKNSKLKHNVHVLRGDFTDSDMKKVIESLLCEKKYADLILSDMAPEVSGIRDVDHEDIIHLAEQAYQFVLNNLDYDGCFICKLFQGGLEVELRSKVKESFDQVFFFKPEASRSDSREIFLVALGFKGYGKNLKEKNKSEDVSKIFSDDFVKDYFQS